MVLSGEPRLAGVRPEDLPGGSSCPRRESSAAALLSLKRVVAAALKENGSCGKPARNGEETGGGGGCGDSWRPIRSGWLFSWETSDSGSLAEKQAWLEGSSSAFPHSKSSSWRARRSVVMKKNNLV